MNRVGILAPLQSRPGKEAEVEQVLQSARPLVEAETGTTAWFAFKVGPAMFGIFDTLEDEEGRKAHIHGEVAKALLQRRQRLLRRCAREGQSHTRVTCSRTNGPEMFGAPKRSKPQECLAAGLIKFPLQMVPEFGAPTHDLGCR